MKFAWLSALFGKDITSDSKITKEEIEAAETKGQQLQDENTRLQADLHARDEQITQLTEQITQSREDAEAKGGQITSLTAELEILRKWKSNHTQSDKGAEEARDAADAGEGKKGFVADASYNKHAQEVYEKYQGKKGE